MWLSTFASNYRRFIIWHEPGATLVIELLTFFNRKYWCWICRILYDCDYVMGSYFTTLLLTCCQTRSVIPSRKYRFLEFWVHVKTRSFFTVRLFVWRISFWIIYFTLELEGFATLIAVKLVVYFNKSILGVLLEFAHRNVWNLIISPKFR